CSSNRSQSQPTRVAIHPTRRHVWTWCPRVRRSRHGQRCDRSAPPGFAMGLPMTPPVAMTRHTGRLLAEVGFLLILFAGIWLVAAQIRLFTSSTRRTIVAGAALAIAGLLLIIATSAGHFGSV